MADLEFDMGDPVRAPDAAVDGDSDSTMSDWDMSDSEIEAKAAQKAAEKAAAEEAERQRKEREKSTKQKIKEREEAERKKKEARIAELNRLKSPEELQEEQEEREQDEADDFFNDTPKKATDELADKVQSVSISSSAATIAPPVDDGKPSLYNFKPKTKGKMTRAEATQLSEFVTEKLFEFQNDPNFIVVVDQVFRQVCSKHDDADWEKIKQFGKTISAIGNEKQTSYKKKTEKKKRTKNRPQQAKTRDDDFGDAVDYDDFM